MVHLLLRCGLVLGQAIHLIAELFDRVKVVPETAGLVGTARRVGLESASLTRRSRLAHLWVEEDDNPLFTRQTRHVHIRTSVVLQRDLRELVAFLQRPLAPSVRFGRSGRFCFFLLDSFLLLGSGIGLGLGLGCGSGSSFGARLGFLGVGAFFSR